VSSKIFFILTVEQALLIFSSVQTNLVNVMALKKKSNSKSCSPGKIFSGSSGIAKKAKGSGSLSEIEFSNFRGRHTREGGYPVRRDPS
jgi:hypothetical protein